MQGAQISPACRFKHVHVCVCVSCVAYTQELYGDFSVQDTQHFTIAVPRNDIFLAPKASMSAMSSALE